MTLKGYRHRILVIDRSWSIHDILAGQQSGLEEFFHSEERVQAEVGGRATYSVWEFDDEIRRVLPFAELGAVRGYQIVPRGNTAMYDAVGDAAEAEGRDLAALPEGERPEDVVMVVSSDGQENCSNRRTGPEVKALLDRQQGTYSWRVIFMGCNQDALKEGAKIGTTRGLTVNTVASNAGSRSGWKASADYLARIPYAASAAVADSLEFNDDERNLAEMNEEEE